MGIKDLLRFMKPYIEPIHVKKYAGQRVGIDAYSWLHKGAYSCSMELHLNTEGDKKFQYLNYFMHRINLLRHYKITPVVVFDGGNIPFKAATQDERERRRQTNRDLAMEKLKEGSITAASELFQASNANGYDVRGFHWGIRLSLRAVSITPSMAHQLIQILRSENIEFIVAPYEADAQLAFMSSLDLDEGGIAAVISEDSDLLAYGCPAVIFKMDRYGNGQQMILDKVFDSDARVPSFKNFDKKLFTGMCVLAGCDFLPSVPGIGITKAHCLVSKYRNLDCVLSILKFEKGCQMPETYPKSFKEAAAVFQHARIYDVVSKQLKHIKPLPQELIESFDEELDFLGPFCFETMLAISQHRHPCLSEKCTNWGCWPTLDVSCQFCTQKDVCSFSLTCNRQITPSLATAIAQGDLDPCTMEAFDHLPSSRSHTNKIRTQKWQKQEAASLPSKECCFTAILSCKSRKLENIVVKQKKMPCTEGQKYLNEDFELAKLITPLIDEATEANTTAIEKAVQFPDNNPFKKRKIEEVQLELIESATEPVSLVTETECSEVMCITLDSQQSVDSKPIVLKDEDRKVNSGKKVKRRSCHGAPHDKSSILNFFSRV